MIDLAIDLANLLAAALALYLVTCACNAMSKRTRHVVVVSYIAVGIGAIGSGLEPWLFRGHADEIDLIRNAGLALLLWATRRKSVLTHARGGLDIGREGRAS